MSASPPSNERLRPKIRTVFSVGLRRRGQSRHSAADDARPRFRHPAQVIVLAFAGAVSVGTALLLLPVSRTGPGSASVVEALFTATSAVCVTGLIVVDTPVYWSGFGQAVILILIQVGGFGIMTLASMVALLISRRLGLRSRLIAAAETKHIGLGDLRQLVIGVAKVTLLFEATTALALTARFLLGYDEPVGRAAYLGLFHAVSAFNNAGFALFSDNLIGFAGDPWICLPIAGGVIAGGLGFPVWFEIRRHLRQRSEWSMHTRITGYMTVLLLVSGTVYITAAEWSNPGTLGALSAPDRLLAGFFASVQNRTAGFNSIDISQLHPGTLLGSDVMMFIGGGSASTAGGIKVTTFALLLFAIYAEVRGEPQIAAFDRRVDNRVLRQALSVALLAVAAVVCAAVILIHLSPFSLDAVLFEVISAFATVGLSTGITAQLPVPGQLLLVALMFLGRLGPVTLVSALALRGRQRLYQVPEGRPMIG